MTLIVISRPDPFRYTWWFTPLPDNATIDPNSAAAVGELAAQAARAKPNLNVWSWTSAHTVVDSTVPRVPVICGSGDSQLNAMFARGVPLPAGITPTNDSDSALTIYLPGGPLGGEYWEMQAAHLTNGQWYCNFGGHMTGVDGTTRPGHYINYTSGPAGTYELNSWGTQGSGLPYWPGVISADDLARGCCDHAILLEVIDALKGSHVWPAIARSDGGLSSSNLIEGQRYRLPRGTFVDPSWHPILQCVVRTLIKYGCFITDRTTSNLCFRAAPDCGPSLDGVPDYDVLTGLPWGSLQLCQAGSDSNPIPS